VCEDKLNGMDWTFGEKERERVSSSSSSFQSANFVTCHETRRQRVRELFVKIEVTRSDIGSRLEGRISF
jgi:hypothetical protein